MRRAEPAKIIAIARAIRDEAGGDVDRFYASRGYRPLWAATGRPGEAATALVRHLASAEADGLRLDANAVRDLRRAIGAADGGDPRAVAVVELALSKAFVRYVGDQRRVRGAGMKYADRTLEPKKTKAEIVLRAASFPKSLAGYVTDMAWMSPQYVRLRDLAATALAANAPEDMLARLRKNQDRARMLPGPWTRHVEVDASSGRLWYYEAGKQIGTMRVVVGAKATPTPMLAGRLQWAILSPYWNVPDYLAQRSIAQKVLGGRTLAALGMEALSGWENDARPLSANSIDWPAVAAGKKIVRLRELPGPRNSMGKVKFIFRNEDGIYLHDTPARALLRKDDRHFSNGCIRLENAAALGRWLLQRPLPAAKTPEMAVALPVSVPVYLTYLTAAADQGRLTFRPDIYGRDD